MLIKVALRTTPTLLNKRDENVVYKALVGADLKRCQGSETQSGFLM